MITNIKQFITERNKNPKAFKTLNESFDELEAGAEEVEATEVEETEEGVTLESFIEMLNAAHEAAVEACEEGEECADALTEDQIAMVFSVVEGLLSETPAEEVTAEDEDEEGMPVEIEENVEVTTECNEDEDESEEIEEGLGSFLRGGTKEEIEEKKKEITAKLQEIEKKYAGKGLLFKDYGGNDKPVEFKLADALKVAGKNNYLGSIQVIPFKDKFVAMWKDGKKGMNKVAAGTKAQTAGE